MIEPGTAAVSRYVGLGWVICDHVMLLPGFPPEDHKVAAKRAFTQAGGPVVRALLLMRRFGESASLIGAVGNDPFGREVLHELQSTGIDTRLTTTDPVAGTRVAHVWLASETGSRTIAHSMIGPEVNSQIDGTALNGATALLLDGRHPAAATNLAGLAMASEIPVAIDMGSYKDYLPSLVANAEIIIGPKQTWVRLAQEIGYTGPLDVMLHLSQATCVLTNGPEHVLAVHQGRQEEYVPTPVHAVDSNGAGDVFFGAFVWARANLYPLAPALQFAASAAAAKCRRLGNAELPSLEDVLSEGAGT